MALDKFKKSLELLSVMNPDDVIRALQQFFTDIARYKEQEVVSAWHTLHLIYRSLPRGERRDGQIEVIRASLLHRMRGLCEKQPFAAVSRLELQEYFAGLTGEPRERFGKQGFSSS